MSQAKRKSSASKQEMVAAKPKYMNKTNIRQKKILAEFMMQHPNLARKSGDCGKALANKLWAQLTAKLNAEGPPYKDTKLWRKVFTDQKHSVKKKITLNEDAGKISKRQIYLSKAEQQIIEAAGLDTTDLESMPPLSLRNMEHFIAENRIVDQNHTYQYDSKTQPDEDAYEVDDRHESVATPVYEVASSISSENEPAVLNLLNATIQKFGEHQETLNKRLDNLITKYERSLDMMEEQHAANMEEIKLEIEIKTIELEMLKTRVIVKREV